MGFEQPVKCQRGTLQLDLNKMRRGQFSVLKFHGKTFVWHGKGLSMRKVSLEEYG